MWSVSILKYKFIDRFHSPLDIITSTTKMIEMNESKDAGPVVA